MGAVEVPSPTSEENNPQMLKVYLYVQLAVLLLKNLQYILFFA
jgi:hypothetical protein